MKKYNYVHVLMAAGAAMLLFATPAMAMKEAAGPGPGFGPMGGEHGMKHEKGFWKQEEKSLGLTDEQRAQMKTLREEGRAKQQAFRKEMKAQHEALRRELDAEKPDRAKAEAIVKELSTLEERIGLDRVDMVFKIRQILTPEQYKKLQAFHEKRRAEMKKKYGMKNGEGMRERKGMPEPEDIKN